MFSAKKAGIAMLLSLLCGFLQTNTLWACNACGGNMTNYNPQLMLFDKSHLISLSNNTRMFHVELPASSTFGQMNGSHKTFHDGEDHTTTSGATESYDEIQSAYELRGIFYPSARWLLGITVPLSHNMLYLDGESLENHAGLGDITISSGYLLVNRVSEKMVRQRWAAGGGIKLPTGRFNMEGYEGELAPHRQEGTGSVDFILSSTYVMTYKKLGWLADASYKLNTPNRNNFKFANTFNGALRVFYTQKTGKLKITPNMGGRIEAAGYDREYGVEYSLDTGGQVLFANAGIDLTLNNFGLFMGYFLPVWENLHGIQFENSHRFQAGLKYIFNKQQ